MANVAPVSGAVYETTLQIHAGLLSQGIMVMSWYTVAGYYVMGIDAPWISPDGAA